jgi:hypothetical protein
LVGRPNAGLTGLGLRLACAEPGDQLAIFGEALRELTEAFTDRVGKTPLRHIVWPSGSTHFFDGNHIHDLQNCGPEPVTSIHVYSPPLTSMTFYDHRPDSYLAPLRSDPLTAATGHAHSPLT